MEVYIEIKKTPEDVKLLSKIVREAKMKFPRYPNKETIAWVMKKYASLGGKWLEDEIEIEEEGADLDAAGLPQPVDGEED